MGSSNAAAVFQSSSFPSADGLEGLWSDKAPLYVVLNTASGRTETDERLGILRRVFEQSSRVFELIEVKDPKQLRSAAQQAIYLARQNRGAVVAAGGDGTINALALEVLPTGLPFGVLPQGTFNYFGRNHGLSSDIEQAAQDLLTARIKPVQVGQINDRIFLVNGSMGLYPDLLQDREAFKQRFGRSRLVAFFACLSTLFGRHPDWVIKLDLDGKVQTIRTPTLFVGNNELQLEQIGIPEAPALEDGRLVAITVKPIGKLAMLWLLMKGAVGQLGEADQVFSFAFNSLTVEPRSLAWPRRLKVATDGEVMYMRTPLHFQPAKQRLQLLVPK